MPIWAVGAAQLPVPLLVGSNQNRACAGWMSAVEPAPWRRPLFRLPALNWSLVVTLLRRSLHTPAHRITTPGSPFRQPHLRILPHVSNGFGAIISGLVLNFIPEPVDAVQSMMKRANSGGLVAAYVWDYAGRMDFLRVFWEAAVTLDPAAVALDEGKRFPLCQPEHLESTFREAGLSRVETDALDVPTLFRSFSDYWEPFLAGTGPAPNYVSSLDASQRDALAADLKQHIDPDGRGKIEMIARAWAVRGELE